MFVHQLVNVNVNIHHYGWHRLIQSTLSNNAKASSGVLVALLVASTPYTLPSALKLLPSSLKSHYSFAFIKYTLASLLSWLTHSLRTPYDTYNSRADEDRYWRSAARSRARLAASDARYGPHTCQADKVPLVTYYTPRLLPTYREDRRRRSIDIEGEDFRISPRAFCKWHRMVHRGPSHPTLSQASELMKRYSHRDLQEMQRMSRLLSDDEVFNSNVVWTPRYKNMWKKWLDTKGPDTAIVFE